MSLIDWKLILDKKELQEVERCISLDREYVKLTAEAVIAKMANQLDKTDIVISDYKQWEQERKDDAKADAEARANL